MWQIYRTILSVLLQLWLVSSLDAQTPTLVKDIFPGPFVPAVGGDGVNLNSRTAVINGVAYFWGNNRTNGDEPWRSDGTAGGTAMVTNVNSNTYISNSPINNEICDAGSSPTEFTNVNGAIFYLAYNPGLGLYKGGLEFGMHPLRPPTYKGLLRWVTTCFLLFIISVQIILLKYGEAMVPQPVPYG
ncbi:hypothetical protein [Spirosoma sp. KNUC1025]|uniref:hypothetical protein n=1 Tax=Spirosoma sp. KNUC1025 TaxID=2894082 RepID=UPI001E384020|nr:hypothetical protein [Spirosoma sp. KNUC1025]UFH57622.1 hypothetical protein LN737_30510 [Spirosoma sp. KNUC1025]